MRGLVGVGTVLMYWTAGTLPLAAQYQPPQCDLNTGHFLVNQAVVYLKNAAEEQDADKRSRLVGDARRNLLEAVSRGEEENAAVWYFLGRAYKEVNDAAGADSAFDRARELAPECEEDIAYHRQLMWVPRVNEAVDSLREGDFKGAKRILREANVLWDKDPIAFYYLARIFGNEGEADSAIAYFRKVVEIGVTDSARADQVKDAYANLAYVYAMLGQAEEVPERWDSAAAWYERYREKWPGDPQALLGQAQAYEEAGKRDRAMLLYDSVLARADDMEPQALFQVGAKMFLAQKLVLAARAFEAGLSKNPYSRDGWFNAANTYFAMTDDPSVPAARRAEAPAKMLAAARRLVQLDPRNQDALRLLAGAHQLMKQQDSTNAVLARVERLQWEVVVDFFEPTSTGWGLSGRVKNLTKREVQVPEITFEFVDAKGNVVATYPVAAQRIEPEGVKGFQATASGEGIAGWRYKVGS